MTWLENQLSGTDAGMQDDEALLKSGVEGLQGNLGLCVAYRLAKKRAVKRCADAVKARLQDVSLLLRK